MSWVAVARKDFRDAIRSRMFWALAIVFGLLSVGLGAAFGYYSDQFIESVPGNQLGVGLVSFVQSPITIFIMFVSAIICHKSIVGEWEQGSLKLLLSLPHTRLEVITGKIVGRSAVLAVPAIASLVIGLGVGGALLGTVPIVLSVEFLVAILVYIVLYVSIFVGLSAVTRSSSLAVAGAIVLIVVQFFWGAIAAVLTIVLDLSGDADWLYIYQSLTPNGAFNEVLSATLAATTEWPAATVRANNVDAVYATPVLAALILLLWFVVPVALGYWRFSNADL
ncbi:ABC transporter permease subunit [Halapricum hydrolyticum]|uniref:ABC transporter permease n=1 Tax=Halapricum hydrolyticum TaxID=2979991 RepID=A0AAE3LIM4_9EURY|nr:ABC transporter permease subunit [Halapricum hydrolyticum]MCU4718434.1 ABC transporter permease [Halapricum hydrolyticum]MCU4726453.1 ABC transporter permease [Halapricum hydrolyticum]